MEGAKTHCTTFLSPSPTAKPLRAGKSLHSLGRLDAYQERAYKRKRNQGFVVKRAKFGLSQMLCARETRFLERGRDSHVKIGQRFPKFVQRHRYLSSWVAELETRLGKAAEDIKRLDVNM